MTSCSRWIAVCVDMFDHDILAKGPFDRRSAWLWLIANAAWKDRRVNHKGKPLELKRGQVLAGRAHLADVWGWGEKQVRNFLDLLQSENMIEKGQSDGHYANVITVCNYDVYQNAGGSENQSKGQSGASAGPERGQTYTSDTNTTREENNNQQHLEPARASAVVGAIDFAALNAKLARAGGAAMRSTAVSIHDPSPIVGCLQAGADLDLDVIPTIERIAGAKPAGSISGWSYFAGAIAKAAAARKAGSDGVAKRSRKISFAEESRQAEEFWAAHRPEGAETNKNVRLHGETSRKDAADAN